MENVPKVDLFRDAQLVHEVNQLSLMDGNTTQSPVVRARDKPEQIVYSLFKHERCVFPPCNVVANMGRTRRNKYPPGGNNAFGRNGTLKCDVCRQRRVKVRRSLHYMLMNSAFFSLNTNLASSVRVVTCRLASREEVPKPSKLQSPRDG